MTRLLLAFALASMALPAQPPGYPSRAADLDVLPGFRQPPPGYGEVGFYWWLGDPLTKDRLTWQLDQLKGKGVTALQVNYAHSDKGGRSYGLTFESQPGLFTPPWWDLFGWFLKQASARGMAASLSDYTLGWAGNGWYMDQILREHPETHGAVLTGESHDCANDCTWHLNAPPLRITAFRLDNGRIAAAMPPIDLRPHLHGRELRWTAPPGQWRIISVSVKDVLVSIDPMHPLTGRLMIEKFFQPFEDRNPGESGKGLNFFFSDELSFGVRGWLWNSTIAAEFQKRKGYDVQPELASLFEETGPRAVKIRLDYSDVMVALEEENYFRPVYDWHTSRGMLYGCDHGGRGRDVTEFGDYFRTQRWMSGPGNDQPNLASDVIKNKVASSIAHLYQRPRTWLEGYYGSGWGTTSAQLVDATWRNFAHGHNLLTLHGLYYSTHGGWWEWAPPDNHFRMPYWAHMGEFLHAVERMSYLLSQGVHRADVAIVYPVAAVEAGPGGKESVETAFAAARTLIAQGIDIDFIDFESLARAQVEDRKLVVAGEQYRVLVLPAMRAARHSTIEKAVEFHRAGGLVATLGDPPQATDRNGSGDPQVLSMAAELNSSQVPDLDHAIARMDQAFARDFHCAQAGTPQPSILHRRAGNRDIYMVYGAAKDTECILRSTGAVELWDPWTGAAKPLPALRQDSLTTTIRMPLEKTEAQLIVFTPGRAAISAATPSVPSSALPLDGPWEFELDPTLDNRYGDYRQPPSPGFIAAESRRFRYSEEGSPSAASDGWPETTYTFGPRFWKLGPLPNGTNTAALEQRLTQITSIDPEIPIDIEGRSYRWSPYDFSWRWGIENDPGHQGYHGLKSEVPSDFLALGRMETKATTTVYTAEPAGSLYYLWTSAAAPRDMRARIVTSGDLLPARLWINQAPASTAVALHRGSNPVLLRYDKPGRGHFLLLDPQSPEAWKQSHPLAGPWFGRPGIVPFDTRPATPQPTGWYRTTAPPGMSAMRFAIRGQAEIWVDGKLTRPTQLRARPDGVTEYRITLPHPHPQPVPVAFKIRQQRGSYAGAAFVEPLAFDCAQGLLDAGDWARIDGLSSYSGGAWYRRNITLTTAQARARLWLDLGGVSSSAEVRVNGKPAGIRLAPPFRIELTGQVTEGANRIEIRVYSALSNHYQTIPTRYRKSTPSGLLGPVRLLQE